MADKSLQAINERIRKGEALVLTAEEMTDFVEEQGPKEAYEKVDVVTTATFGAMCSSGAFLSFGHSDPPIKMGRVWLNDVLAYAGIAAVDAYIGATELSEKRGIAYGGAHVIEDLVKGKDVLLRATSPGTHCYPRKEIETLINLNSINQAILFNPRNCYQNYAVAVNSGKETRYTYLGTLLPEYGNVTFSSAGALSPLLNDPYYKTIGIGTRIFLGGAPGYISWQGTQHNPGQARGEAGVPLGGAGTLSVIGDLKQMQSAFLRAASIQNYGTSLYVGIGVPIPIISEEMVLHTAIKEEDILAPIFDYSVPQRQRPLLGRVSYKELRSGSITLKGKTITTAPLSSYKKAREIAKTLQAWIQQGEFLLSEAVQPLPLTQETNTLDIRQ